MNRPHPRGRRPFVTPEWEGKAREMVRDSGDEFLDWALAQVGQLPEEDRDEAESGLTDKVIAREPLRQAWIERWFFEAD